MAPLNILVVEDDQAMGSFLVDCLQEGRGHKVVIAGSIAESEKETNAPGFLPDVILHDYQFPDGTGPGAVLMLRNRFPNAKIIGMTGDSLETPVRRLEFLAAGADDFITKPFLDIKELVNAVETPRKEQTA